MSVGFGFSAGDFIAAIELVGTVVGALSSSSTASLEYQELISQLLSLKTALIQVKRLEFEESQYAEVIALRQAAAQCHRTIDGFLKKIEKYQPSLSGCGKGSRVRDTWMKVKWAVCRKEDVARFKTDLVAHTESIQLLLMTVQMGKTTIHHRNQDARYQSLAGFMQDGFFDCMQRLKSLADQEEQSLEMMSTILQTSVKVFQIVLEVQQAILRIPGQVEGQRPVYLIDALGKHSPFHLEFIRSAEALVSVLRINFREHGDGAEKIDKGEFVIQDLATKRDIDLKKNWEVCFRPGQTVEMSMVFHRYGPKCQQYCEDVARGIYHFECPNCSIARGRIDQTTQTSPTEIEYQTENMEQALVPLPARKELEVEDIARYRKVRIYENISFSTPASDDVGSVSNATSKEEEKLSSKEEKKLSSKEEEKLSSNEEAKRGKNASLEPRHPSNRRPKPKKKYHWEWFWFCCACRNGPLAANGYNETCVEWNCGHTRCSCCKLEKQKVRDAA